MGANYLSYVKSIATFVLTFLGYIISILDSVWWKLDRWVLGLKRDVSRDHLLKYLYQIFSCWILIPNLSMTASGIQKTGLTLNNRSSWPNRLKPAMPNWKRRKRIQLKQLQFGSILKRLRGICPLNAESMGYSVRILAPNHFSETTFIIKLLKVYIRTV